MSNGAECCALGICCPPNSPQRRAALLEEMKHGVADKAGAQTIGVNQCMEYMADWLIENVDMLPKGTLDFSKISAVLAKG